MFSLTVFCFEILGQNLDAARSVFIKKKGENNIFMTRQKNLPSVHRTLLAPLEGNISFQHGQRVAKF